MTEEAGMKNNFTFRSFGNSEALVEALSEKIAHALQHAIEQKGRGILALSGGSTPKKLLQKLSMIDLEWKKVMVTLVDERWVSPKSQESNENLIVNFLLQNKARFAMFVPLKNIAVAVEDGLLITQNRLKEIDKLDVVVLGMGTDAHTASFFPQTKELEHALHTHERCCATTASVAPFERMTLSRNFLLSATHLFLHIEGEQKKKVFDEASQSSDINAMPIISMMQQTQPKLEVYYA